MPQSTAAPPPIATREVTWFFTSPNTALRDHMCYVDVAQVTRVISHGQRHVPLRDAVVTLVVKTGDKSERFMIYPIEGWVLPPFEGDTLRLVRHPITNQVIGFGWQPIGLDAAYCYRYIKLLVAS